jgi:hypothetical protein
MGPAAHVARVAAVVARPLAGDRDGLEALPIGHGAQATVGGDQVDEVGRARAGQADDDDRLPDLLVEDLRVAPDHVLDAQACHQVAHDVAASAEPAHRRGVVVLAQGGEPHPQALAKVVGAEVLEAGLAGGLLQEVGLVEADRQVRGGRQRRLLHVGEDGVREVGDADLGGSVGHGGFS